MRTQDSTSQGKAEKESKMRKRGGKGDRKESKKNTGEERLNGRGAKSVFQ